MLVHCLELAGVLLLMSAGHGVLDPAPGAAGRVARNFFFWVVVFAAAVLLFWSPLVAAWLVRVGMVVLVAYGLWWAIGVAAEYVGGPYLLEPPNAEALAEAARRASGLPPRACRRLARHMLREHDPYVALLALERLDAPGGEDEAAFEAAWRLAADEALAEVKGLTGRGARRVRAADIRLVAQALCLYEATSVERALHREDRPILGGRAARNRFAAYLEKHGRRSRAAERLGLTPFDAGERSRVERGRVSVAGLVWPAWGLFRAGLPQRAATFAVSHGLLLAYGLAALGLGRGSGWVYLAVAALVHIEGAFAQADFPGARPAASGREGPE